MKNFTEDTEKPRGWLTIHVKGTKPFSMWIADIKKVKKEIKENARAAGVKARIFVNKKHGFPTADKLRGLKLGD